MPTNIDQNVRTISWSPPVFIALMAISLAIWWAPLTSTFALALNEEQYTHILLILPISATLIFLDSKADWKLDRRSDGKSSEPGVGASTTLASAFLVVAVFVNAIVRWKLHLSWDVQLATTMLALVLWWIAAFLLCFGLRAFRLSLFPLCFLLWMVPLPGFVVSPIVGFLQQGSAASAHLFFAAAGVPVAQRGMLVHIPGLTLEVAPECSSIRSSAMLLVTTMVVAHLLLRSTWRRVLVVAAAIPLSVAKNGLRIFTLGVLATRVDPSFLSGRLHRQGGGIFLLIALGAIFLLIWILRRGEAEKPKLDPRAPLPEKIYRANA
ncbi:MAG TPA: exosortase/archaeosortase family protein [Candidatus Eremiobacteraceae bacterium]|nr:exosortase/archaeosortase family protein [Candidatus Eremiobacteraceae bacterium]